MGGAEEVEWGQVPWELLKLSRWGQCWGEDKTHDSEARSLHSFINQYLLSTYYVPGLTLSPHGEVKWEATVLIDEDGEKRAMWHGV